jgi:hypothetical protein
MKTKVVHCKQEPYDVYIGRGNNSIWGNPFTHINDRKTLAKFIVKDRHEACLAYLEYITNGAGKHLLPHLKELKGKTLGCWCKPQECHGDVLKQLIEKLYPEEK